MKLRTRLTFRSFTQQVSQRQILKNRVANSFQLIFKEPIWALLKKFSRNSSDALHK